MHLLPTQELPYDPNQVTPGVIGFAVTALFAIVVMLLLWDFNRRVRRINDREEVKARLQAEIAAAEASTDADRSGAHDAPVEIAPAEQPPQPERGR